MSHFSRDSYRAAIEGLKKYETIAALRQSRFYAEQGDYVESILNYIWQQPCSDSVPRLRGFIRAVQWNIERGKHIDAIVDLFSTHPVLGLADIITLNEVDVGMNRTGNRNIAFELGSRLSMHSLFAAEYIELTKGIGEEASLQGENQEALHGNSILSRYPFKSVRILRLPSCFNTFRFSEKRYGDRLALIAEIDCNGKSLILVSTHLEVRNTPSCRALQFRALVDAVSPVQKGIESTPVLIGGDLNTGTFKRGNIFNAMYAFVRLIRTEPPLMRYALRHPEFIEPLFSLASDRGFSIEGFNDDMATCSTILSTLDEAAYLPSLMQDWIYSKLAAYNHQLDFRLDYFLARGLHPLLDGERKDSGTNTDSLSARTLPGLCSNGSRISDHDPIVCDLIFPD
jgi:endonuclease/exonuclease/phosphatase family metal-dependent hydrolase